MPVKKKRTGHTDYRTGGMFYSKFNKGGILENFFLSPQAGGPTDEEVGNFRKSLIKDGKLPEDATLSNLVQYVREQNKQKSWSEKVSRGQVPRKEKEDTEANLRQYGQPRRKARGGYVKKDMKIMRSK